MYKKILVGFLVVSLLTTMLAACAIYDEANVPQGPQAHMAGASFLVSSPAGSSCAKCAACPDQSGTKSPEPFASDLDRRGATAPAANGNSGGTSDIGPTSRIMRFTIPRAGRPVNTFVSAVCLLSVPASARR